MITVQFTWYWFVVGMACTTGAFVSTALVRAGTARNCLCVFLMTAGAASSAVSVTHDPRFVVPFALIVGPAIAVIVLFAVSAGEAAVRANHSGNSRS